MNLIYPRGYDCIANESWQVQRKNPILKNAAKKAFILTCWQYRAAIVPLNSLQMVVNST